MFSKLTRRSKRTVQQPSFGCPPSDGSCFAGWEHVCAALGSIALLGFLISNATPVLAQFGGPLPISPAVAGGSDDDESAEEAFRDPADLVKQAIGEPPAGKRLTRDGRLWVDIKGKRVIVDGYVAMNEGPLEMFACPAQTKEHESVVAVLAKAQEIHAALLAVGTQQGTPVQFSPKFVPPTGQRVRVWVMWRDKEGKVQKMDAKKWVQKTGEKETLDLDWVFAGSRFWTDPASGKRYYEADSGDLICVSNFGSAMMDLPTKSSKDTGNLQFSANTELVPEPMTPVRLILVPIPVPQDDPDPEPPSVADPDQLPEDRWLPTPKAAGAGENSTQPDAGAQPNAGAKEPEKSQEAGTSRNAEKDRS